MYDRPNMRHRLSGEEGRKSRLYRDSIRTATVPDGYLTGGVGWNFDANGVPESVKPLLPDGWVAEVGAFLPDPAIDALLDIGIDIAEKVVERLVPQWRDFSDDRQEVLVDLAFNMGEGDDHHGLRSFHHFLAAVNAGDWAEAKVQLLGTDDEPTLYAKQVGQRAPKLAAMLTADGTVAA